MRTSEPGITKVGDNVWDVRVEGMRGRDGKRNQQRQHVRGSFEDAKRARALLLVKVGRVTKEARMMTVAEAWYPNRAVDAAADALGEAMRGIM